ncbi:AraC family transcriptional regulator [Paraburkholderia nemoris]|uniref:AraC family transcriptional regulator n=1 Tax=Paraburkholderia nemoris TaxID=2793076 RepID=UPI001B2302D1|nr:AraC family transcriptional regulator [Paraburkholderia nemoris]CAE6805381.1 putative HTH-type transcriptional regulator [Paraburkholderia nemoris]
MSFWDFTRSPASARLLTDFGHERGVSHATLLAGTGLTGAQLDDPNVEVTAEQELRLTDNLLRSLGCPAGLGFEVGLRYHFSAYGVWGYGLISSATARDALALALRFLPLTYAFTVITYREEPDAGVVNFDAPELPDALSRFCVERDMAAAAILLQETAGVDFALSRFTLQATRATSARHASLPVLRIGGVEPEYGARSNTLAFARAYLNRPLPHANPITVSMCEQMCSRLLDARRARVGTSTMVRHYLNATWGGGPLSLEEVARMMNTSARTLKRRLQEGGTTFRTLVNEARSAMAETLLSDEHLTLTEIAERLGYSDLSSFSQAFKRWYGVAPQVYRAEMARGRKEEN